MDGLNLDFENVDPDDRDLLTAFVKDLGTRLRSAGKILSIDVPPDSNTDWSEPYDYAALSKNADYLVLMDYEEHWASSSIMGSVSSLPWFVQGVEQIIKEISGGSKLIVGCRYTQGIGVSRQDRFYRKILFTGSRTAIPSLPDDKWDSSSWPIFGCIYEKQRTP